MLDEFQEGASKQYNNEKFGTTPRHIYVYSSDIHSPFSADLIFLSIYQGWNKNMVL